MYFYVTYAYQSQKKTHFITYTYIYVYLVAFFILYTKNRKQIRFEYFFHISL